MELSKEILEVLLVGVASIEFKGRKWVNRCINNEHIEELIENGNNRKEDINERECRETG